MIELAAAFQLSSDQIVRKWVREWRAGGDVALQPKGRPAGSKSSVPVTEEDRLRREVKQLAAENAYLKNCGT